MRFVQYPFEPMGRNEIGHMLMTRAAFVNQKLLVHVCLTSMKHYYVEDGGEVKPL